VKTSLKAFLRKKSKVYESGGDYVIKDEYRNLFSECSVVKLGSKKGVLRIMVAVCRNNK